MGFQHPNEPSFCASNGKTNPPAEPGNSEPPHLYVLPDSRAISEEKVGQPTGIPL